MRVNRFVKDNEGSSPARRVFFTRREAAGVAGVSVSTLDRLVKAGQVPYKRVRRRVLFPKSDFIAWCVSDQGWSDSMGVAI
jgi:excisionase family DNA binding protein